MIDPKWLDRDSFLIPHALWRDASGKLIETVSFAKSE